MWYQEGCLNTLYVKVVQENFTSGNMYKKSLKWKYNGHNQFKSLNDDTFGNLSNLGIIHLDNNKLSTIPDKIFARKLRLRKIKLKDNRIEVMSCKALEHFEKKESINLYDVTCDISDS